MSKIPLRCAIYTRKSSEEGLEQGFNSLDAQREACEAFILSQQHEGWRLEHTLYDDGGYSGGNIERPALKHLLSDIDQKKIQVVVVYKVDRLTRSIADFAKIVELFDAKGISFVSVTQQFNTTSSMGRLTLNVLLSFAQFEREVTGERIRDKIAASKQKGMWMGGYAPIGYAGFERTLVIIESHATIIRHIYQRYLQLNSIRALKTDLDSSGIYSPERTHTGGKQYGGVPFSRGNLQRILSNPVYIGKITHFDKVHSGQHAAIVDDALWNAVQHRLLGNKQSVEQRLYAPSNSLLKGILYDAEGQKLSPSHSQKQSRRFRYYLSHQLINNSTATVSNALRIPARELEVTVINQLCDWLRDTEKVVAALNPQPHQVHNLITDVQRIATDLQENKADQYYLLRKIIASVAISHDYLSILIKASALSSEINQIDQLIEIKNNVELKRCGYQMRLILTNNYKQQIYQDKNLINHISKAYQWLTLITSGKVQSIKEIAEAENLDQSHVTRMINKAFLAPDITRAILNGNQPTHLTLKHLKQFRALPNDWNTQKTLLGFTK